MTKKLVKSLRTKQVDITIGDDDILRYEYHTPHTVETLKDAEENIKQYTAFVKSTGKSHFHSIIDLTNLKTVEHGVRKIYRGKEVMALSGLNAVVAKNPVARMIGNFFIKVDRPSNPTRLFATQEDAAKWINGNKEKYGKTR